MFVEWDFEEDIKDWVSVGLFWSACQPASFYTKRSHGTSIQNKANGFTWIVRFAANRCVIKPRNSAASLRIVNF